MTLSNLTHWIHKYISTQEDSAYIDDDVKPHAVFYSICQAFFHLFVARYKHFVESKSGKYIFIIRAKVTNLIAIVLNTVLLFRNIISSKS